jgi:hypothetical protein
MLRVVEKSKTSRNILGALNSTFVALIWKQNEPNTFEHYRPISLCVVCKIITKILANKFKVVLLGFISKDQFVILFNNKFMFQWEKHTRLCTL